MVDGIGNLIYHYRILICYLCVFLCLRGCSMGAVLGCVSRRRGWCRRGSCGQMRVIEAIMAVLVVVFAVSFVDLFAVTPVSPKYESSELEKIGYNVLHDLDEERLLARFVNSGEATGDWSNLTAALAASLPTDVYFNLTVFDGNGQVVNKDKPIGYGTSRVFAASSYVASVTYVVPGYAANYKARVLLLQLVRG